MLSLTSTNNSFIDYTQIGSNHSISSHDKPRKSGFVHIIKSITVEPITFCYACALILHAPLIQQYVYQRLSIERNLPTSINTDLSSCDLDVTMVTDEASIDARKEVQSMTSYVYLGIILSAAVPSLFMALLLGSWSDKVGRKIIIMLPVIGGILDTTCILITMVTSGPLYVLFIGSFFNGVCGFFTTMILAVFSYMADVTTESNRALRLGLIEAVAFCSGMISHISSGWWVRHLGFQAPYIFILTLHFLSLLYIILLLPESLKTVEEKQVSDLFNCSHFYKVQNVFQGAELHRRYQLYGLLVVSAFLMVCSIGFGSVIVLYSLDAPFCFSPILIGYFLADCMFMQAIGAIIGLTLIRKLLSDILLTQIGIMSIISSLVTIAFISKGWQMFIVPIVGCFGGVCMPVIRARMSNLVKSNEQGALFSSVATLETLCTLCGAGIFNSLYPITEKHFKFKGFCFLVMAILLLVPALILCLIGIYFSTNESLPTEEKLLIQ